MPELTPPMSREQLFDLILIIRWSEGAAGPRALEAQDRILAEFDRLTAAVSAARADERERCAKAVKYMRRCNHCCYCDCAERELRSSTPPAPEGE